MSKLVKCDQCGKSVEDGVVVDWLELDRYDTSHRWFWPVAGPAHFCSWNCLAAWVERNRPMVPCSGGGEDDACEA